jgi:hypothetical protein
MGFWSAPGFAEAANHTVAPLAFNLNVEKRDIISETITLTNTTGQQIRLYASVNEVSVDGEGVVEAFVEPSLVDKTTSPTSWIEINRGRIELAPGEVREVPFTVRMNPNTAPGDYSVFIGFGEGSNQPEAAAKVMQGQAPGTLVNLVVDKKQDQFLRLERFTVDKFVTGRGESQAVYTLYNPGAVDVVPKGEIIFYDSKGIEAAAVPLNSEAKSIERDAHVEFRAVVPNDLPIGKYKAFLSVEYGEHMTDTVQDTTFFYVVPLREVIMLFVALLFIAVLLTLYVHRRFDVGQDDHGAESVALYVKEGRSADVHHDIDLKKKSAEAAYEQS